MIVIFEDLIRKVVGGFFTKTTISIVINRKMFLEIEIEMSW
jgi:hypothetical protein